MTNNFLKLVSWRMIILMLLLTLRLMHSTTPLAVLIGQTYSLMMYVVIVLFVTFVDIALIENMLKPISNHHKYLLIALNILTIFIGIAANLYEYHIQSLILKSDDAQSTLGYIDIALISIMFEAIQKLILVIRFK